jgi:hypothetical protein
MAGFDGSEPDVEAAEPDDVSAGVISGAVLPAAAFPSGPVDTAELLVPGPSGAPGDDIAGEDAGGVSELEPQPLMLNSRQSPVRAKTRERICNLWRICGTVSAEVIIFYHPFSRSSIFECFVSFPAFCQKSRTCIARAAAECVIHAASTAVRELIPSKTSSSAVNNFAIVPRLQPSWNIVLISSARSRTESVVTSPSSSSVTIPEINELNHSNCSTRKTIVSSSFTTVGGARH